jgi:fructose-specific phosphotransferase system IIC component
VVIAGLAVFALSDGGKDAWAMFLAVAFNALWVAYLIGVIPALVVGIVFAVIDYRRRRSSFLMALLVGGVAGIVWWYLIAKGQPSDLDNWMIVGSLVATVVCWRICRRPAERNMGNAAA